MNKNIMRYQVILWDDIDDKLKKDWIDFSRGPTYGLVDTINGKIIHASEDESSFDDIVDELNELNDIAANYKFVSKCNRDELDDVYRHLGFSDWIPSGHGAVMIHEDARMEIRPDGYGKWIVSDLSDVNPFSSQSFDSIGKAVQFVIEENCRDYYGS